MANYKVRVSVFDAAGVVKDQQEFTVSLSDMHSGSASTGLVAEVLTHLKAKNVYDIDVSVLTLVLTSYGKLLTYLDDAQRFTQSIQDIFLSGRYSDLLRLKDQVCTSLETSKAIIQEARMIDPGRIYTKLGGS